MLCWFIMIHDMLKNLIQYSAKGIWCKIIIYVLEKPIFHVWPLEFRLAPEHVHCSITLENLALRSLLYDDNLLWTSVKLGKTVHCLVFFIFFIAWFIKHVWLSIITYSFTLEMHLHCCCQCNYFFVLIANHIMMLPDNSGLLDWLIRCWLVFFISFFFFLFCPYNMTCWSFRVGGGSHNTQLQEEWGGLYYWWLMSRCICAPYLVLNFTFESISCIMNKNGRYKIETKHKSFIFTRWVSFCGERKKWKTHLIN